MANRKQREDRNKDICSYFKSEIKKRKKGACEIYAEIASFHSLSTTMVKKILDDNSIETKKGAAE